MTYYGRYEQTLVAVTIMDIRTILLYFLIGPAQAAFSNYIMSAKCVHTENLENFFWQCWCIQE